MVSLSEGRGGHSHSFAGLDAAPDVADGHPAMSTEKLLQHQPSHAAVFRNPTHFAAIPTTFAAFLQVFVFVGFLVMIFILSDVLHTNFMGGVDPPFALLTSIHVGVWLIVVIIDRYLHYHHRLLRTFGYLDFYTRTKDVRRLPLWILSLGNAVLLVIVSILGRESSKVNLIHLFQIIVSGELVIALLASFVYIRIIIKFNKEKRLPDAFRQTIVEGFNAEMYASPEIGFRDQDGLDEVLEKQTEMIRYLQQHNSILGKKIVELRQEMERHDK